MGIWKGLWVWRLLVVALLLVQVLASQQSDDTTDVGAGDSRGDADVPVAGSENDIPGRDGEGKRGERDGKLAVDAAWTILRSLEVPTTTKYEKRSGFLSRAKYYGKEIFYLLFMNRPAIDDEKQHLSPKKKLNPRLQNAVQMLEGAVDEYGDEDAMFLLAEMNFYGNFTHPRNYKEAFRRYQSLASLSGNSTAQYMLGFMYATGVGGSVERDQAKALLYHTFAAEAGNTRSEMTVAYRHHVGIGTPKDCNLAAYYYKRVADKAIGYYRSGPPGGRVMSKESYVWVDEEGGVYGEGASVSSSGMNAQRYSPHSSSDASLDDVLEYLDLMSKKGDVKATFSLGKMFYDGSRSMPRNVRKAMKYFGMVAKRYWTKDGKIDANHPAGIEKIAAKAAGHIGLMYLRGEGTEQNYEKAFMWFRRGRVNGDPLCQYQIGLMYLHGYGVEQDAFKAATYFSAASEQDFPAAQTRLGALFLDQGDVPTATRYFELAARYGWMEAFYYLAEIFDVGIGKERHCGMATAYYKMVAEKAEDIHSSFIEANDAYEGGDKETALIDSMMAAEQGYENAQSNVAFLLDEQRSVLPLDSILPWVNKKAQQSSSLLRNAALALIYWTRSAKQSNVDSLVKMGDYYLRGLGTEIDVDKASTCYQSAAEGQHSAQAYWNLGWMHENGIAVEQDFHMAKRYYDLALETTQEAYLPVKLSLIKLRARSFWNSITGGGVNSIRSEPDPKAPRTLKEWITTFLDNDEEEYYSHLHRYHEDHDHDDPTSSNQDSSSSHHDQDSNTGTYYDEIDVDLEDGVLESLVIVALAATLVVLVYVRQQRALRRQQQQGQGQGQQGQQQGQQHPGAVANNAAPDNDRGFFPRPDEPEFGQWAAGGVGH
ncbi:ERAD-associated protein [Arachnomyces sp. PD_36]|nr:ERAD-associated protein [Arachnomyces sp. PD_36]